ATALVHPLALQGARPIVELVGHAVAVGVDRPLAKLEQQADVAGPDVELVVEDDAFLVDEVEVVLDAEIEREAAAHVDHQAATGAEAPALELRADEVDLVAVGAREQIGLPIAAPGEE